MEIRKLEMGREKFMDRTRTAAEFKCLCINPWPKEPDMNYIVSAGMFIREKHDVFASSVRHYCWHRHQGEIQLSIFLCMYTCTMYVWRNDYTVVDIELHTVLYV